MHVFYLIKIQNNHYDAALGTYSRITLNFAPTKLQYIIYFNSKLGSRSGTPQHLT